jgi:hypothetical protein
MNVNDETMLAKCLSDNPAASLIVKKPSGGSGGVTRIPDRFFDVVLVAAGVVSEFFKGLAGRRDKVRIMLGQGSCCSEASKNISEVRV